MPKKPVRNAFYFFMQELQPQLRREGRVFPNGMADVVPIAHPRWKALSEKEKERFENMAKTAKAKMRGREGDQYRLDNVGNIVAHRKDPYTEMEKRRMTEKKDMRKNWPPGKALARELFYFINFQYLCKTEEGDYLPCEIAIIEYSIEKGITKKLHRFIEPGKIPTGYRFTCVQNSDDTHQIPIDQFELADANYRGLWIQIENFINPKGEKQDNPPLFCLGVHNDWDCVEYCLRWIHGRACLGEPNRIRKIYEIESLFQEMHAHIGNSVSKTLCIDMVTSADWDYEINTKCDYHEEKESKYCSLGVVNRYAYALSDSLCSHFGVQLTENHLPMRQSVSSFITLSPSTMPVCNKQESRMPARSDVLFQPQQQQQSKPVARQEDPDEDYRELRRPKIPDYASMGRGSGAPAAQAWGGMGGAYGGGASMPAIGRGMTLGMQELDMSDRHVGQVAPPPPMQAPPPPRAWQKPAVSYQQPLGIGRGMISQAPPSSFYNDEDDDDDMPPLRRPGQAPPEIAPLRMPGQTVPDMAPLRRPGEPAPAQAVMEQYSQFDDVNEYKSRNGVAKEAEVSCVGRGRGGILDHLMRHGVKTGVPCGRGYAPPNWIDDGSIGPIRKP